MPLIEYHYRSDALNRDTTVDVLLPEKLPADDCPVVTLLHGMHGSYDSWLRKTCIERFAAKRGIAVIMPDGANSFYQDMKYGEKYFTLIASEIPERMRNTFGFSAKREKNFIAGLSMGGYGAFHTALCLPWQYAGAASLSGSLDLRLRNVNPEKWPLCKAIWGEDFLQTVPGSDADLMHLFESFPDASPAPKLFFARGTEDPLYPMHRNMIEALQKRGDRFNWTAEEGPGAHNWIFWNDWIGRALDAILPEENLKTPV